MIPSALSLKLPTGWQKQIKIREQGATAGQRDTYFIDPEGKRYRSVVEVKRALGMRGPTKGGHSSSSSSSSSSKNKKKIKIPGQLSKYMLKKIAEQKETEELLKREAVKGTGNVFFDSTVVVGGGGGGGRGGVLVLCVLLVLWLTVLL